MRIENRLRTALVVMGVLLLPLMWWAVALLAGPSDGTLTVARPGAWSDAGIRIERVYRPDNVLLAGDLVTAIDGVRVDDPGRLGSLPGRHQGDVVVYTVRRGEFERDVEVLLAGYPFREALVTNLPALLLLGCLVGVAVFVFVQRAGDPAARILVVMLFLLGVGATSWPLGAQVIDFAGGRGLWPMFVGEIAFVCLWASMVMFGLVFPNRSPVLDRHRWIPVAVYLSPFVLYGLSLTIFLPSRHGIARLGLLGSSQPVALVFPFVLVAVILLRFRRIDDAGERRRMRWLLVTGAVVAASYLGISQLPELLSGHPLVDTRLVPLVFLVGPLALGVAILRYRIFDIEVILRRSLVYGLVSGCLFLAFVAFSAILGQVLGYSSPAWILGGAFAVLWFQPSVRLGKAATRLIYGARDEPYELLSRLSDQLEVTTDHDAILPTVVETLAHALRLPYAAIELSGPDGTTEMIATHGHAVHRPIEVPLTQGGVVVGRLLLDVGSQAEPFGAADERLLRDLSRHVGSAARLVMLNAALQKSVGRLVNAREEERLRVAHDLHDGIGPTLGASIMRLGVARELVRTDPDAAEDLLDTIVVASQEAISEIRRIVDDLRPAALDELGLLGAIEGRSKYFTLIDGSSPNGDNMRVVVEATGDLDHLSPAIEVAAYRITMEALNNAFRHGHARRATVRLIADDLLTVEVIDDGQGLPPGAVPGVGVSSMSDRALELGGSLDIESHQRNGTVVRARMPLRRMVAP